jgi:hypothetical protein
VFVILRLIRIIEMPQRFGEQISVLVNASHSTQAMVVRVRAFAGL